MTNLSKTGRKLSESAALKVLKVAETGRYRGARHADAGWSDFPYPRAVFFTPPQGITS